MKAYSIFPPDGFVEASISLPLSKSVCNRFMIMCALAGCKPPAEVADCCDDTRALATALSATSGEVNIGPAGTAMRFLTAYFAAMEGAEVTLTGNDRMLQRPIGPLVSALRALGADIAYAGEEGYPPLIIKGKRLSGGNIEIDASVSSQFISAVLMVAPTFASPLCLTLKGVPASESYLKMTMTLMEQCGIKVAASPQGIEVQPGSYAIDPDMRIERDWSAASYWYEITAFTAGYITLEGMAPTSIQGDSACAPIFAKLGVLTQPSEEGGEEDIDLVPDPEQFSRLDVDLADTPDLAPAIAVTCCMLGIPFKLTGLKGLRIKECDRLAALKAELAKLSMDVQIEGDGTLAWQLQRIPVDTVRPICTYGDHRMAMAFAPVSYFVPGLVIEDPDAVAKSYPGFWQDLQKVGFTLADPASLSPQEQEEEA